MKRYILPSIIAFFGSVFLVGAQVIPSLPQWILSGSYLIPRGSTTNVGTSTTNFYGNLGSFSTMNATSATIGTLNISSLALSPLIVGGSATTTIKGDGTISTFGGSLYVPQSGIGIGVASSSYELDIAGNADVNGVNQINLKRNGETLFAGLSTLTGIYSRGLTIPIIFGLNQGGTEVARFASTTGYLGLNTTSPTYRLDVKGLTTADGIRSDMGFDVYQVPAPPAPTLALVNEDGLLGEGAYWYGISYTTAVGETAMSTASSITTVASSTKVSVTWVNSTDPRVTGVKVYRSKVGGVAWTVWTHSSQSTATTTITDNTADASLTGSSGAGFYRTNTTSPQLTLNGSRIGFADTRLTSFGLLAGDSVTVGGLNTALGYSAGTAWTTGSYNTAIGNQALYANATGQGNTAIGSEVGYKNTGGSNNTWVGWRTGSYYSSNNSGAGNVHLGANVGVYSTGNSNIFIGYQAADALTTGNNNIVIGYDIDLPTTTSGNTLTIGNLIYGTGLGATSTAVSSGKVGIGTSTPAEKLDVNGYALFNQSYGEMASYEDANDTITTTSTGVYYVWRGSSSTMARAAGTNYITTSTIKYATSSFTVGANGGGLYRAGVAVSMTSSANNTILHCDVFKNGTEQENIAFKRKVGTAGDVGNANAQGLLSLVPNDVVDLRCESDSAGAVLTFSQLNLNIHRISK